MKLVPKESAVSLADFMAYKMPESGPGILVVMDNFDALCAEGPLAYVLCEGEQDRLAGLKIPLGLGQAVENMLTDRRELHLLCDLEYLTAGFRILPVRK